MPTHPSSENRGLAPDGRARTLGTCPRALRIGLLASFLLCACGQRGLPQTPAPTIRGWVQPSETATPPFPAGTPAVPVSPTPSPTPVTYTIASGDTMSSIAIHFGVSLQALEAANPGIPDYRFLPIGKQLLIPATASATSAAPTPTPMPLEVSTARCFPTPTGATWCLADVRNPGTGPVEDVTLQFTLYDDANRPLAVQGESLPLGLLPAGVSLPAATFFAPLERPGRRAQVTLVGDVVAQNPQQRYLPVELVGSQSSALQGGLELAGQARLSPQASAPASHISVLLVLYDQAGQAVGLRVLQIDETWRPGQLHSFSLRAYALGGQISNHALFLEARP